VQEDTRKASGDGLDDYIRVSSPGLLVIIGALSLILVATVVWGFIGKIPVTTTVTGCVVDAKTLSKHAQVTGSSEEEAHEAGGHWVVCFVDSSKYSAEQLSKFGNDVTITMPDHTTIKGQIEAVSSIPLNPDEAREYLNDGAWIADECIDSNYNWGIAVHVHDDISDHLFTTPQVTIITDEVPPIRFLAR
jgi:hypothetical protein